MLQNLRFLGHLVALAMVVGLWGCEQAEDESVADPSPPVKSKQPRRAPTKPAVATTNVSVGLPEQGEPAQWQRLYGSIVTRGDKTIVQLASYPTAEKERYPSLKIHAIETCGPQQLAGRTVKAKAYFIAERGGVVWQSPSGQPIELQITSTDEGRLIGEIVGGVLTSGAKRAEQVEIRGKFQAELIHSPASAERPPRE